VELEFGMLSCLAQVGSGTYCLLSRVKLLDCADVFSSPEKVQEGTSEGLSPSSVGESCYMYFELSLHRR